MIAERKTEKAGEDLQKLIEEAEANIPPREGVDWLPVEALSNGMESLSSLKDIIIIVNTIDFHCAVVQRHTNETQPKKIKSTPDVPSEFLTLEQVIHRLFQWRSNGFLPNEPTPAATFAEGNFNDGFDYIKIHWTPKGYLWCDKYNTSFPSKILDACIAFPSKEELEYRSAKAGRQMKFAEMMLKVADLDQKYTVAKIRKELKEIFPKGEDTTEEGYNSSLEMLVQEVNNKLKEVKAASKPKPDKPVKNSSRKKKIQDEQSGESIQEI